MVTRYASTQASNNLPVGDDTIGAGTSVSPYLTLSKALQVAVAGDVVISNGNHTADASLAQGFGFFNIATGITVQATVPGIFTLRSAAGVARTVNINSNTGSVVFDGFIVDSENGSKYALDISASNASTVSLLNSEFKNPGRDITVRDNHPTTKLVVKNCKVNGAATTAGLCVAQGGAGKRVEIDRLTGIVTGITASKGGAIVLTSTATGSTARITHCDGLSAVSNNAGSACGVIHSVGFVMLAEENKNMILSEGIANSSSGIILVDPVLGVTANGGLLIGNSGFNLCSGGYLQRVGTDGGSSADNLTNFWESEGNEYTANPNATTLHGIMFGSCLGGRSNNDLVRFAGISFLSKLQTTGAVFSRMRAEYPVGGNSICYSKGSVGVQYLSLRARLRSGISTYIYRIDDDTPGTGTHSTGAICKAGNILSTDVAGLSQAVLVGVSCTATFENNNWSFVSVSGTPWSYSGTGYSTFAAWITAQEPTARNLIPTDIAKSFHRESYRQLASSKLGQSDPWMPVALGL